jgi:radical SAM superfamily enzyme YgiQ (UPF0313 family)
VYSGVVIPRLGLPILATLLNSRGHSADVYVEALTEFTPRRALNILNSDLVGISLTTSTAPRGYALARLLGLRNIPVIFGGPHATFLPEEALKYGDYVLCGEAEQTFPKLVDTLQNGGDVSDVPNLVYREDGEVKRTPSEPLGCSLDDVPIPDLTTIVGHDKIAIHPAITTRGCPYNCTFCSVSDMFGRKYRMASVDRMMEEARQWTGKKVFFCDDNFTAVPRHTKELLDSMLTHGYVPKAWSAQVRADAWKDEELMDLFKRTNCNRVYVGYESVNQAVLDDYDKGQTVTDIKESVAGFHSNGIQVHGMFMFGDDYEGVETFDQTLGFVADNQIDTVQFLILTPVPGTQLFNKIDSEGRIITYDWSLYDGHHVVFEPARMSPLDLQLGVIKANRRFYSVRSALRSISTFRFTTALMRYWGKRILHSWYERNASFMKKLRSWQKSRTGLQKNFSIRRFSEPTFNVTNSREVLGN